MSPFRQIFSPDVILSFDFSPVNCSVSEAYIRAALQGNLSSGFSTRVERPQMMASRGLKFQIKDAEVLCSKNKDVSQLYVHRTANLLVCFHIFLMTWLIYSTFYFQLIMWCIFT